MSVLPEAAVRAKVIELLNMCNRRRLDMWLDSGVRAGVLDIAVVERCLNEEILQRATEVKAYWLAPCNCRGHLN